VRPRCAQAGEQGERVGEDERRDDDDDGGDDADRHGRRGDRVDLGTVAGSRFSRLAAT
jgi:hypothetical protein